MIQLGIPTNEGPIEDEHRTLIAKGICYLPDLFSLNLYIPLPT